jgi:hypothetical protein
MRNDMTDFDSLAHHWQQQPAAAVPPSPDVLIARAVQYHRKIRQKHRGTLLIILLTVGILGAFFFYVTAWRSPAATLGLGLMIGLMILRIVLEWVSLIAFQRISPGLTTVAYTRSMRRFYQKRKLLHYILTPLIYILYFAGFAWMLPVFAQQMSNGFFIYIIISGIGVFFVLGYLIVVQNKKEIATLKYLNGLHIGEDG